LPGQPKTDQASNEKANIREAIFWEKCQIEQLMGVLGGVSMRLK
jgi:hypothetical protein